MLIALLQGQDSGTLFPFWVLGYRQMRQGRDVWAGFWLPLILQRFQILTPTLFIVVLKKRGRILAGFAVVSLRFFGTGWVLGAEELVKAAGGDERLH